VKKLGEVSNYSIVEDEAGVTVLANVTCPVDQLERISIKAQTIPEVKVSQGISNPAPVKTGVQYSIKVEDIFSTTDDTDPSYRVDEPIVVTLTVKHNQSATFSVDRVMDTVGRAVSALMCDSGTTSRVPALQRLSTRPTFN
jgi:hypothetical protein